MTSTYIGVYMCKMRNDAYRHNILPESSTYEDLEQLHYKLFIQNKAILYIGRCTWAIYCSIYSSISRLCKVVSGKLYLNTSNDN